GAALIVTGATIRFRCFRELGRYFTFALSLRDNHALITSGPFTGGNTTVLGAALILRSDGSWWAGGGYTTAWGLFLGPNLIVSPLLIVCGFLRGVKECMYLME
ncbi:hypothetical protein DFH09DRAFT_849134, partial [Mycena vulgaris]